MGMKLRIINIIIFSSLFFSNQAFTQVTEEWVRKYDGESFPAECHATAMTIDEAGNVYVTGSCVSNPSIYYCATIKYSSSGKLLWKAIYNSGSKTSASGIVTSVDGSVYVVGTTITGNDHNIELIKYDSLGNQQWVKIFGDNDLSEIINTDCIASDENGNLYFSYRALGFVTIKCNSNGEILWEREGNAKLYNGTPYKIKYKDGNVLVGGYAEYGFYIIKYNANGDELWQSYTPPVKGHVDILRDMTIDNMDNIYVVGSTQDTSNFEKLLIVKYDPNGNILWNKQYGEDSVSTYGLSIAVNNLQKIYITGTRYSHPSARKFITFGLNESGFIEWEYEYNKRGSGAKILFASDGYLYVSGSIVYADIVVFKLNTNGQHIWDISYSEGDASVNDMKLDMNNNIIIGGKTKINGGYQYLTIKYSQSVGINNISTQIPKGFELHQNYPNPFNPETMIRFELPKASFVKLSMYDISGKLIGTLVNDKMNAGVYEYRWNGMGLSSGVYIYRLEAGGQIMMKRMMLVK